MKAIIIHIFFPLQPKDTMTLMTTLSFVMFATAVDAAKVAQLNQTNFHLHLHAACVLILYSIHIHNGHCAFLVTNLIWLLRIGDFPSFPSTRIPSLWMMTIAAAPMKWQHWLLTDAIQRPNKSHTCTRTYRGVNLPFKPPILMFPVYWPMGEFSFSIVVRVVSA